MTLLRAFIIAAWLGIAVVTASAIANSGMAPATTSFFAQFADPWGAQIMADVGIHIALLALWIIWREDNLLVGIICAFAAFMLGGAFSLLYLLITTFRAKGDLVRLAIGNKRADALRATDFG